MAEHQLLAAYMTPHIAKVDVRLRINLADGGLTASGRHLSGGSRLLKRVRRTVWSKGHAKIAWMPDQAEFSQDVDVVRTMHEAETGSIPGPPRSPAQPKRFTLVPVTVEKSVT